MDTHRLSVHMPNQNSLCLNQLQDGTHGIHSLPSILGYSNVASTQKGFNVSGELTDYCNHYAVKWFPLTMLYTEDTAMLHSQRLYGMQHTIMIDYFEADLVWFNNLTPIMATKALDGLQLIHELSICHADMYQAQCTVL